MERSVEIVQDDNGRKIVVIQDIRFKGRQNISWKEVEKYLKQYVGSCYVIAETADKVYIGSDLPDEYTGSKDTKRLKGASAKAKANAAQGIPELIEMAINKSFNTNLDKKHNKDAKYGWYRYDSRFALPIYNQEEQVVAYNIFSARMLVRHAKDGKLYLYDILRIKKETSKPLKL